MALSSLAILIAAILLTLVLDRRESRLKAFIALCITLTTVPVAAAGGFMSIGIGQVAVDSPSDPPPSLAGLWGLLVGTPVVMIAAAFAVLLLSRRRFGHSRRIRVLRPASIAIVACAVSFVCFMSLLAHDEPFGWAAADVLLFVFCAARLGLAGSAVTRLES